ncbi:MAG: hypothetical protein P9L88_02420 [Candidatus Tantalella remota]|nr:hypothetical protein [Candidatus Tantalella remota]
MAKSSKIREWFGGEGKKKIGPSAEEWLKFTIADLKNRIKIAKALGRVEAEERLCEELEVSLQECSKK